jgi:hypothetical protein
MKYFSGRGRPLPILPNPGGKRNFERPRRRWEDNIRIDLREIGWGTGFMWLRVGTSDGLV